MGVEMRGRLAERPKASRRWWIPLLAYVVGVLLLVTCAGQSGAAGSRGSAGRTRSAWPRQCTGQSAGANALPTTTLDGKSVGLSACPGWRVVYFWSGACPCVSACERYSFVPLAKKYKGRVSFFAVASCRFDLKQPRPKLRRTIAARRLPFPLLLDPQHKVAEALGAKVTPQAFLLDPQGRVVFSGMPDDSRRYLDETGKEGISRGYLARALSQALAGKPVTQPQVKDEGCIIAR